MNINMNINSPRLPRGNQANRAGSSYFRACPRGDGIPALTVVAGSRLALSAGSGRLPLHLLDVRRRASWTARDAAAPPPWPQELTDRYMNGCKQGSDRLADLCRCSAFRAQDVIPADRFDEFLVADDVNPGFVELINTCL